MVPPAPASCIFTSMRKLCSGNRRYVPERLHRYQILLVNRLSVSERSLRRLGARGPASCVQRFHLETIPAAVPPEASSALTISADAVDLLLILF